MNLLSKELVAGYSTMIVGYLVVIGLTYWWTDLIPFTFTEFWASSSVENTISATKHAWLLFAWGVVLSLFYSNTGRGVSSSEIVGGGFLISAWAGIVEEISFRWLAFFGSIGLVALGDFIFGGFIFGNGLIWLIHTYIFIPITNFFSFGLMSDILYYPGTWLVGAAMIAANVKFRDGHKYQGVFGLVNSWFAGLYFFWLMFTFGIVGAIVVHFLYDFLIFATAAIKNKVIA